METKETTTTTALTAMTGYTNDQIKIIKATVAKGTSNDELGMFLGICKSVDLNPFLKQIWCYKDGKGNLLTFAGRDGFLTIAQRDARWSGMAASYVCKNDEFKCDTATGKVEHVIGKDRGEIVGAYALIKPKGCELATVIWVERKDFDKGYNVWKTNPGQMIQKVAETHCLRKAFGISGLNVEYDFEVKGEKVIPIAEVKETNELDEVKAKICLGLKNYNGKDRDEIRTMCTTKLKAGEFDLTFAKVIADQIGVAL